MLRTASTANVLLSSEVSAGMEMADLLTKACQQKAALADCKKEFGAAPFCMCFRTAEMDSASLSRRNTDLSAAEWFYCQRSIRLRLSAA